MLYSRDKKNAMKMLKKMLSDRMTSPGPKCGDFFNFVIEELDKERRLVTENIVVDLMLSLIRSVFTLFVPVRHDVFEISIQSMPSAAGILISDRAVSDCVVLLLLSSSRPGVVACKIKC